MADDILKILKRIQGRFKESFEAFSDNHNKMIDDLLFIEADGNQWPEDLKKAREADGRPCLEINKIPVFLDQVLGNERANRPSIKARPVDDKADIETARIISGAIKNIENISNAEIAYDTAFEAASGPGKGAFRIVTEYAGDDVFEQDIRIKRIKNSLTVYPDPNANEWSCEDGRYMIITELIPRDDFTAEYLNADPCNFEGSGDDSEEWISPRTVRVAEYFEKEEISKKLYLIRWPDGEMDTVDDLNRIQTDEYEIIKERDVKTHKITWCKVSGKEVLEGPIDWAGKYFPIILVWGKELNIEGRSIYSGMIRNAKEPSRLYNYSRSLGAELIALAPKAPYLATPAQIQGHESQWNLAHKKNYPYLLYNPDPKAPGLPHRQFPAQAQTGIQSEVLIADQEIHDTIGLHEASLGERSNEKSGIAIAERRRSGDRGQFAYIDNLARALKYAGKVLVDLIPKIWDTARFIRIELDDGETELVKINEPFEKDGKSHFYDLAAGTYDVVITAGLNYATQRIEAADNMVKFVQAFPDAAPVIGDLIAKNMDWPGAEEIAERLKKLLPPGLIEQPGGKIGNGTLASGGPSALPPPPSDPVMELKIAQEQAKVDQEQLKAEKLRMEIEKIKIETIEKTRS